MKRLLVTLAITSLVAACGGYEEDLLLEGDEGKADGIGQFFSGQLEPGHLDISSDGGEVLCSRRFLGEEACPAGSKRLYYNPLNVHGQITSVSYSPNQMSLSTPDYRIVADPNGSMVSFKATGGVAMMAEYRLRLVTSDTEVSEWTTVAPKSVSQEDRVMLEAALAEAEIDGQALPSLTALLGTRLRFSTKWLSVKEGVLQVSGSGDLISCEGSDEPICAGGYSLFSHERQVPAAWRERDIAVEYRVHAVPFWVKGKYEVGPFDGAVKVTAN